MTEKDKAGFLAAQIELAQKSLAAWPKWLQEVSQVESADTCDQPSDATRVESPDEAEHQEE